MPQMKAFALSLLLTLMAVPLAQAQTTETVAKHHMVAAANPHAAQAGLDMLRAGGSAVDAAIATQMVLGLVEPESSGIGGGAFMLVYDGKTHKTTSFDGREMAPGSATPGMFLDAAGNPRGHFDAIPGGLSVGIPGVVGMLDLAHKKYGKYTSARLFQPAIKLGRRWFSGGAKAGAAHHQGLCAGRQRCPTSAAIFIMPTACHWPKARFTKIPNMPPPCAKSRRKAQTVFTKARLPRRLWMRFSTRPASRAA